MLILLGSMDDSLPFPFLPISHPLTLTTGQLTTAVSITTIRYIPAKVTHLRPTEQEDLLEAEIQIN